MKSTAAFAYNQLTMPRMSYDITAKGFQEIYGKQTKVFFGLESGTGRVMRQSAIGFKQNMEEVGKIDLATTENVQAEFEKITGLKANSEMQEPVTTELKSEQVTATSPKRTRAEVRNAAGSPVMPTVGKSKNGEADVDPAGVSTEPNVVLPTHHNEEAAATAERIANEQGKLSQVDKTEIADGGKTVKAATVPKPLDSGTDHGTVAINGKQEAAQQDVNPVAQPAQEVTAPVQSPNVATPLSNAPANEAVSATEAGNIAAQAADTGDGVRIEVK